jgi:hypothetical protein
LANDGTGARVRYTDRPDPLGALERAQAGLDVHLAAAQGDAEYPIIWIVEALAHAATALERFAEAGDAARAEPACMEFDYYHRALAGLDPGRMTAEAREAYQYALGYADEMTACAEEIRVCLEAARTAAAAYHAWVAERRQQHEAAKCLPDVQARMRVRTALVRDRGTGAAFRDEAARYCALAHQAGLSLRATSALLQPLLMRLEWERAPGAVADDLSATAAGWGGRPRGKARTLERRLSPPHRIL